MTDDHTADRKLWLRISKNGGNTWGDPIVRDLPETGDFDKRIKWTRCGNSRQFVVSLEGTSPVGVTIIDASYQVSGE